MGVEPLPAFGRRMAKYFHFSTPHQPEFPKNLACDVQHLVRNLLATLAEENASIPMLSRTHG